MLDIVVQTLANAGRLSPQMASTLACVSKSMRDDVKLLWQRDAIKFKPKRHKTMGTRGGCRACLVERASTPFALCRECVYDEMKLVSATIAKSKYLMTEEDLDELTCMRAVHTTFNKPVRYFDADEVKELAVVKHKGFGAFARAQALANSEKPPSKAKLARAAKLEAILTEDPAVKDVLAEDTMDVLGVESFLSNGSGGIKALRNRIARWGEFDVMLRRAGAIAATSTRDAYYLEDIRGKYVRGQFPSIKVAEETLRSELHSRQEKRRRRGALAEALASTQFAPSLADMTVKWRREETFTSPGDLMADAARACKAYIAGETVMELIDVVAMATEAAYFIKLTAYEACLIHAIGLQRRPGQAQLAMSELVLKAKRLAARQAKAIGMKMPSHVEAYTNSVGAGRTR